MLLAEAEASDCEMELSAGLVEHASPGRSPGGPVADDTAAEHELGPVVADALLHPGDTTAAGKSTWPDSSAASHCSSPMCSRASGNGQPATLNLSGCVIGHRERDSGFERVGAAAPPVAAVRGCCWLLEQRVAATAV